MNKPNWQYVAVAVLLVGVVTSNLTNLALAHGGDANLIHACVSPNGSIRIVGANSACHRNETPLDWRVQGETGPAGPQGVPGPVGPLGPSGDNGLNCWDLNSNGLPDPASEDLNGDTTVNVLDCQGSNDWLLVGNSNTNSTINFLGTTDNQPLVLKTSGIERARITEAGNVGIGTTTPLAQAPLDVHSSGDIDKYIQITNPNGGSSAQAGIQIVNDTNVATALVQTSQNYVSDYGWDHTQGAYLRSAGAGGLALAALHPAGFISLHTGGVNAPERVRIDGSGRVGIGTPNPQSTFQVVGNYIQFPTIIGAPPPNTDCNSAVHAGRTIIRTDGPINLYICTGAGGWVGK